MTVDDALTTVSRDQNRWSFTATALKSSILRARWTILTLAVIGATLETWGAQIHSTNASLALAFGYSGAAVLAVAAVIRQWKLGHERVQAWIMARSGSESLKKEMYLFRTGTGPYASANPDDLLLDRRNEILSKLQPFQKHRREPKTVVKSLGPLDANAYLAERINGPAAQIQYFTDRASEYFRTLRLLNAAEFILAMAGAFLGAALTTTGRQAYGAWVAVITTISGALAAHALAQRYDQLIVSYRAAADRLVGIVARWNAKKSASLGELVEPCEAILLEENLGWIAGVDQSQDDTAETPQTKPIRN